MQAILGLLLRRARDRIELGASRRRVFAAIAARRVGTPELLTVPVLLPAVLDHHQWLRFGEVDGCTRAAEEVHCTPKRSIAAAGYARAPRAFLLALVILASTAIGAETPVYKCTGERGTPQYQETPCTAGRELRNFATDPPPLSVVPGIAVGAASVLGDSADRPRVRRARGQQARATRSDEAGDAAERRHAHAGMSEAEVLAKLGRPAIRARGGAKAKTRWTYLPAAADPDTITTLYFDHGAVVEVERRVIKR